MVSPRAFPQSIALLIMLVFSFPAGSAEPERTAEEMMIRAHEARAMWHHFPGFSAEVEISTDGTVVTGHITVAADGELNLKLPDSTQVEWARRRLESLVNHRLPREEEREFHVAFADDIKTHPLGRLIRFQDDRLHSVYRISGDVITEVHRDMGPTRFTISVTKVTRNAEGKYLPHSYSVSRWDTETGNLTACDTVRDEWVRVDRWDLPARILSIRTQDDGQREVRQIIVRNPQLLGKASNQ